MYSDVSSSRCAEREGVEASALVRIDSVWSAMVRERLSLYAVDESDWWLSGFSGGNEIFPRQVERDHTILLMVSYVFMESTLPLGKSTYQNEAPLLFHTSQFYLHTRR
jgi:hypothetical protein